MFGLGGPGYTQALNAGTTASNVGAGYGAGAAGVNSQLLPFLTRELNNPQGFTQQQQGSMLGAAEGGAGGSTAGITTEANLAAGRHNSGDVSGALDDAARQKDKALAETSEGIAGKSADLQQQQQQSAASGLSNIQGMDTNAQLKAMGLVPEDVDAATKAYGTGGWAGDLKSIMGDIGQGATLAAGFGIPGFSGFNPKG